jgi:hypothetical protein
VEKEDMVVLAVDVDELAAELAEPADRDEGAVDESLARPLVRDRALDEELSVLRFGQAGELDGPAGDVEDGLDERFFRAGPDEVRRGLVAEEKADGVDQDGLARPRFAREDGKPLVEADLERLDRGQIPDPQELDHVITDLVEDIGDEGPPHVDPAVAGMVVPAGEGRPVDVVGRVADDHHDLAGREVGLGAADEGGQAGDVGRGRRVPSRRRGELSAPVSSGAGPRIQTPGAATSTSGPKFEKEAIASL